jgi:hypothetical protein
MVFEDEKLAFERFIKALKNEELESFEEDSVRLADVREKVDKWHQKFFSDVDARVGGGLVEDLFSVARHIAQNEEQVPKFFDFEVRDHHDLDAVAHRLLADRLSRVDEDAALDAEYLDRDRYWRVIYYNYDLFKSHYDACVNRILHAKRHGNEPGERRPRFKTPEAIPIAEPPEDLKDRVKSRDGFRCLCCGYGKQKTQLQVDHISPSYRGGNNHFDNLQTLCKPCNGPDGKGIDCISFRNNQTTLTTAPSRFRMPKTPTGSHAKEPEWWEMFIRRTINLFFRCAAVDSVKIGAKGEWFWHWQIRLFPANNEKWFEPHLPGLIQQIRQDREKAGYEAAHDEITLTS